MNKKENQILYYKVLRNARKESEPYQRTTLDEKGEIILDDREIMNRWRQYFKQLLDSTDGDTAFAVVRNQCNKR